MVDGYQVWNGDRSWVYDNVAAFNVVQAYSLALHILDGCKIDQSSLAWAPGAKVADVNLNWSSIRASAALKSHELNQKLKKQVREDADAAFGTLVRYHWKTRSFRAQINQAFGIANSQNLSAAKTAEEWMKGFRDTAITVVCMAGGAVGGGVALTFGVGGALVQGATKYYDTGNAVQAGWATFGGLCMVGWGSVAGNEVFKKGLSKGAERIVIGFGFVLDSMFDAGGAALEGKKGKDLVVSAAVKGISNTVGHHMTSKIDAEIKLAERLNKDKNILSSINRLGELYKAASSATQKAGEKFGGDALSEMVKAASNPKTQLPHGAQTAVRASGADHASIQYILQNVLAPR